MASSGIRWDRVARVALLGVLAFVVLLYVNPARTYVRTWQEAKIKRADVLELKRENRTLQARRRALNDPRVLEREARRLGMVRPGERPYAVEGLPGVTVRRR